jgi:aspartyl aminopeptidase
MEHSVDRDAAALLRFVDASPSPYHAVATARAALVAAGFVELAETQEWPGEPGRYVVVREGSLAAWSTVHLPATAPAPGSAAAPGSAGSPAAPVPAFRLVGAHTDSPNLRVRPQPDVTRLGWDQLGLEAYGGALLNSWLDRDLGLSGRVAVRAGARQGDAAPHGVQLLLWRHDEPLLRIPQLAIHLERGVNENGLTLNPQAHLVPVWGATGAAPAFRDWLAEQLDVPPADVLAWDLMTHDLTASTRLGRTGDLIAAPRLDNLGSCWAGTQALVEACERIAAGGTTAATGGAPYVPLLVLFDHEEVGSRTNRGGDSQFLPAVLERIVLARGGDRQDVLRSLAGSLICSADMAHAVHPNYADRAEPQHQVLLGHGPAVKVNSKARYASDATGIAAARLAAEQAGVPLQAFVTRGDMPCGSTIGPMSASLTGAVTVDVGAPMLSMHSARELTGAADMAAYAALLTAFLAPA